VQLSSLLSTPGLTECACCGSLRPVGCAQHCTDRSLVNHRLSSSLCKEEKPNAARPPLASSFMVSPLRCRRVLLASRDGPSSGVLRTADAVRLSPLSSSSSPPLPPPKARASISRRALPLARRQTNSYQSLASVVPLVPQRLTPPTHASESRLGRLRSQWLLPRTGFQLASNSVQSVKPTSPIKSSGLGLTWLATWLDLACNLA